MDCQKLIRRLVKAISIRDTIPRGATVRLSERLGVARGTVDGWIYEGQEPRKGVRQRISDLIPVLEGERKSLIPNGK